MEQKTSLDKALTVLEQVCMAGESGVRHLAGELGYPASTVHRILSVLLRRNYLRRDPVSRHYYPSLKILELSSQAREEMDIVGAARPILRSLMEATGETSNLVIFEDMEAVYVEQVTNTQSLLRMFTKVGARVPLYCSGVGKAYLAHLPVDKALDYFRQVPKQRHTARTIVEEAPFLAELESIRRNGYALDQEEMEDGVGCVAALVANGDGVLGALSVSGPSSRTITDAPRLGRQVRRACASLAQSLRY